MPIKTLKLDAKRKKDIYEFIKGHKQAVISSINKKGFPQSSLIGIAVTKNLEIICSTFNSSRKYQNIKNNPKVSLVIGWDKARSVQYEGTVEELDNALLEETLEVNLKGVKSIAKYVPREFGVAYKITPKWIRFTNLAVEPWERFEIKF